MMMKIGVFDSGVGGLSVARAIERELPECEVIFVNDSQHVPYGTKPPEVLLGYVLPILKDLEQRGCAAIVIACNTVTTTLISQLREQIGVPLIGMEPMVKPAAEMTKTGKIIVCATPATLSSDRYGWLKDTYAKDVTVFEPDCSDWASMIESHQVDRSKIAARIESGISEGADVIVLGCTHYHWIEDLVKEIANGRTQVMQPETPVITQLKRVLKLPA